MDPKRKLIVAVFAVALGLVGWSSVVYGQAKVGTTGAQFLEIGVSARADGMGGAFAAVSDDATALYYNPAGLVQLGGREAVFTLVNYPADIEYKFAGVALPLSFGGVLGLSFYGLSSGDIPLTTYEYPLGVDGWTFGANDYAFGLTYSRYLTDRFSLGVTVKMIDELFEEERATGWAADVGTNYNTGFRNFKITMVITNFGPDMTFISQSYPLPINFHFGAAIDVLDGGRHRATFAMEGSHPSDNLEKYNAGLEYWYSDMFALRIGDRFEHDLSGITWGLGFRMPLGEERKFSVDYARQDFGVLGDIDRYTLSVMF
jgi:long-subunit fatty acid transport protein